MNNPRLQPDRARAWVTGAGGLIGNYLVQTSRFHAPDWHVIGLTRDRLDLTKSDAVGRKFHRQPPQLIIHCAALSSSVACQANPDLARRLNIEMTRELSDLACEIPFVFLSSDLVFDGRVGHYDEFAPVNPLSVYGETKVAAEALLRANPRHIIIRTSINAGCSAAGDRGFDELMVRAWASGKTLDLFTDEFRSPIHASVTARAIWELVKANKPGLYHVAGTERMSRWDTGVTLIGRHPQFREQIRPETRQNYRGAPRPADTSLNCAKAQALLSFPLPRFSDWVAANPEEPV